MKDKNLKHFILGLILFSILSYLSISFVKLDFNIILWSEKERACIPISAILYSLLSTVKFMIDTDSKR